MPTNRTNDASGKRLIATAFMVALAASVAGCGTSKFTTCSISRPSGKPLETMSSGELHDATMALGQSYAKKPDDKRIATNYAAALQMDGDADQSLAVMRKLAIALPKDRDVLAAYGKALAANGQFESALDAVRRAQTPEYPDWRLVSAEASILYQIGQKD
jgi:Flp pilus assembly protein TadD